MRGARPPRPLPDICYERALGDEIWDLVCHCWQQHPSERPDAGQIVNRLRQRVPSPPLESDWDMSFLRNIRSDLGNHSILPPSLRTETSGREVPGSMASLDEQGDILSTILEEL
jgi:hypothetical protein